MAVRDSSNYYRYQGIIRRCCKPKTEKENKNYKSRGITVCDRWLHGEDGKTGLECFDEDMGECPEGMSIDRIDNDKGYSPDNCRWATRSQQRRNTRINNNVEYNREIKCLTEWSQVLGISVQLLRHRLKRMSVEEAFEMPVRKWGSKITFNGKSLTLREWAEEIGITRESLRDRLNRNWSLEKALKK